MADASSRLIWLDLEMTGLDPQNHVILEIGTVVTDADLNLIARGPALAIRRPESILNQMDPWCIEHHGKSGLTARVKASVISVEQAEEMTLAFLQKYLHAKDSPLCGNSIGQDRRFLIKEMPKLNDFFHYRNIDVSTIKELVRRWYPAVQIPEKRKTHHVLDDIDESIEELKFYRSHVFR